MWRELRARERMEGLDSNFDLMCRAFSPQLYLCSAPQAFGLGCYVSRLRRLPTSLQDVGTQP